MHRHQRRSTWVSLLNFNERYSIWKVQLFSVWIIRNAIFGAEEDESGTERGLEKQFSDDSNQTRRTKSDSFAKFNLPFDRKSFERVQRWRLWAKTSGGRNRVARWRIEIWGVTRDVDGETADSCWAPWDYRWKRLWSQCSRHQQTKLKPSWSGKLKTFPRQGGFRSTLKLT